MLCFECGYEIDPPERAMLQAKNKQTLTCKSCGEKAARAERRSWTVVQEYQKGGYMFVTADAAGRTLRETNQKGVRT